MALVTRSLSCNKLGLVGDGAGEVEGVGLHGFDGICHAVSVLLKLMLVGDGDGEVEGGWGAERATGRVVFVTRSLSY